jgi:hypothetical protein
MRLAIQEKKTPDSSLPDPSKVGLSASETEWMYELWVLWRALDKPSNVSVLAKEIIDGHGGLIAGLLEIESLFAKTRQQLEEQNPKK